MANSNIAAIPYFGGKFRLATKIVPIIESIPHKVYVESFAGGASVMFARPIPHDAREVLNDIDDELVLLYRAMQLYPEEFQIQSSCLLYSAYLYRLFVDAAQSREVKPLGAYSKDEILAVAVSKYYRICNGFGNNSVYRSGLNKSKKQDSAKLWARRTALISTVSKRLASTTIECDDATSVIKRWDSVGTLQYLDPPYPGTRQETYSAGFTYTDYADLCALLDKSQSSYVLSGYQLDIEPSCDFKVTVPLSKTVRANTVAQEVLYIKTGDTDRVAEVLASLVATTGATVRC